MAKTKYYLNLEERLMFYHATFSSLMLYGCQIWGHTTNKKLHKIETLQNSAIRIICNNYDERLSAQYKSLKILKLKDHIVLKNCLLVNDYINNKLPSSFDEYFHTQKQQHSIITRTAFYPKCQYGQVWKKIHYTSNHLIIQ